MLTLSPNADSRYKFLKIIPIMFAAWVLGTAVCLAASEKNGTVRQIGDLDSVIAPEILKQVHIVPFTLHHDSPILLQATTLDRLNDQQKQELKATYRAGYTIVLLDPNMGHISALHAIIGEGVSYRSKDTGIVMAYALRRKNDIPTATLLTSLDPSPLRTPSGDPDPTGLLDEDLALSRDVARTVTELTLIPQVSVPRQLRDANGQVDWLANPIQTTTFAINEPQGVYNTEINVYALYRCLDQTDHYAVTAQADWTATNAQWQGATSADYPAPPNPTMYNLVHSNGRVELVVNWQSNNRTYCSSPGFFNDFADICRYINYPLSYELAMVPRTEGTVTQLNAAPAATQGQSTTYESGFTFQIGGTVNVSSNGPGGGISAGARWSNTTETQVPPLIVDVSNTGNQGVDWNFGYCTTGLEPDPGTDCTHHVQMVKDVCQAQLGNDSNTDPQEGQTPAGKFSNAVQSAHWQQDSATRVGSTFDIEVEFQANTANTIAHLNGNVGPVGPVPDTDPDPIHGCNATGCACVSVTTPNPVSKSFTFEIPFPSTICSNAR
jgi:hypothetical protein